MRFFRPGRWLASSGPQPLDPTPGEAFVQREFGEAVVFASGEWQRFQASNRQVDPAWASRFTLTQRLGAFLAGPIGPTLEERFPAIAATGAEADALTEMTGNARAICKLIVGEAIIAVGDGARGEIRGALPD